MSKQIRLDDRVYERIKSAKRDDESFSNAVERLLADRSFSDLRDVFDEDQVSEMRAASQRPHPTSLTHAGSLVEDGACQ